MKSHVRVFVRTRPTAEICDGIRPLNDGKSITVSLDKTANTGLAHNTQEALSFKFDGVLEGSGQDNVYATCAHEVADSLLSGYNGTVFCYGQTGAGKTYTMSGEGQQYNRRGVMPRALHHIFEQIDIRVDRQMTVRVSFVEVYNEVLFDLLSSSPGTPDDLTIIDEGGATVVKGLTQLQVQSEAEALALLFEGEANRSTAAHALNSASSRSHSIFTVHLSMRMAGEGEERAVASKLNLVDLAGSERTKKTGVTGQALKEANAINKSLTFLEQTVNALSHKEGHVPFRQSKLTHLLKDALGGNCKTVMIANIWPHASHMEETLSTLRFASRVRLIETAARISESHDPSLLLKRYERQIKELKAELAMRDTLTGRGQVNYNDLTDAEAADLRAMVRQFLEGNATLDQLPCDTLKQVKEAYKQMQIAYQAAKTELAQAADPSPVKALSEGQRPSSPGREADAAGVRRNSQAGAEGVGEEDPQGAAGFHVGLAPANFRPPKGVDGGSTGAGLSPRSPLQAPDSPGLLAAEGRPDKNAAFISYKRDVPEGRILDQGARAAQAEHKAAKQKANNTGTAVNLVKREIDDANNALEAKRAEGVPNTTDMLDSEEHQLLQTLKAAKIKFRSELNELKALQSALPGLAQAEAAACKSLIDGFSLWYTANHGIAAPLSIGYTGGAELRDDEAEVFDRMQQAQLSTVDPDSSAFFIARKQVRRKQAAQAQRNFQRTTKVI